MAEKEYIERDGVMQKFADHVWLSNHSDFSTTPTWNQAVQIVEDFPAADVRPVVYCKDCRHRDPEDHKCDCGGTERQGCPFKVADDYFCAYGER